MSDLPVMRTTGIKEARKFRILCATLLDGCCAHQGITGHEGLSPCFVQAERIGFMRNLSR
jgi:hypothetical protein